MSTGGTHIINKQIVEVELSKQMDSFKIQQAVSKLYKEQLEPIISALLDKKFDNTSAHYQIENLTIDLGEVTLETVPEQFAEKFTKALLEINNTEKLENQVAEEKVIPEKTPLKIVAYYLEKGRMPWWAHNTKAELSKQLDVLLETPTAEFKKLLLALHDQPNFVQRYVQAFSAEQLQKTVALVKSSTSKNILSKSIAEELGIVSKTKSTNKIYNEVLEIRSLIKTCKDKHNSNATWQHLFKEAQILARKPALRNLPMGLLREFKQLLEEVLKENKAPETISFALSKHLMLLKKITEQGKTKVTTTTAFDDTDFIPIENAGLVVLWPFLIRFFENLELLENKKFIDEKAQYKAISVLQYLCNENEEELFEGLLPLAKILCGIGVEELVETYTLSEIEKEIANNFLSVIIQQGKSWGTISVNGFRSSYLQRNASLRIRDDHWLLQVEKETFDIVLQKIPWSFNTIKLPWMEKLLMVEWI